MSQADRRKHCNQSVLTAAEMHRLALVWHYSPGGTACTSHIISEIPLLCFFLNHSDLEGRGDDEGRHIICCSSMCHIPNLTSNTGQ